MDSEKNITLNVIVSGKLDDYGFLSGILDRFSIGRIVSCGFARMMDMLVKKYAEEHNILLDNCTLIPGAGDISSNIIILETVVDVADVVIVFFDGKCKSTANIITYAKKMKKEVHITRVDSMES